MSEQCPLMGECGYATGYPLCSYREYWEGAACYLGVKLKRAEARIIELEAKLYEQAEEKAQEETQTASGGPGSQTARLPDRVSDPSMDREAAGGPGVDSTESGTATQKGGEQ